MRITIHQCPPHLYVSGPGGQHEGGEGGRPHVQGGAAEGELHALPHLWGALQHTVQDTGSVQQVAISR